MGLELYAKIEEYLDFESEVEYLHNTFVDIVEEIKPKSLLDIGCGQGGFISKLDGSIDAFGIDLSQNQINIALSKGINASCISLNQVTQTFDMQTAVFDVISYIPKGEIKEFFQNCYDKLNPNGYLVFDANTLFGFEDVAQGSLVIDKGDIFVSIDAYFEDNMLKTNITAFTKKTTYTKKNQILSPNTTIQKIF